MKTGPYFVVMVFLTGALAACTSSAEKRSAAEFLKADDLVGRHEYTFAMNLLDSMIEAYKEDYGIVGEAMKRKKSIALDYHREVIASSEMLLKGLEPQISALSRDFILTPGEAGQPGSYIHKRQTVESSWNRTFLRVGLNESGDIWMTSHYYGKSWIDHTSLRIYDPDDYILTDTIPLGHEWNRKVEDLGDRWETVDFREGSDAGAIDFIADRYQKSVKVRLTGKTFQYIVMESYDKEAFRKGRELAHLLKEAFGLRESIRLHQSELRKLGA